MKRKEAGAQKQNKKEEEERKKRGKAKTSVVSRDKAEWTCD